MNEIVPGIFHWTARHPSIGAGVSSYYIAPAGAVLDPKLPDGGWEALPAEPRQVLLTSGHHARDSEDCARTFDIPIRASHQAIEHLHGRLEIEPFTDRDQPAPGVTYIHVDTLAPDEGAFHIAVDGGAIALADALQRYGGGLDFFEDDLLGDDPDQVKAGLKDALAGLLECDFAHLLFAHGDPLTDHGKTALREFVENGPAS